MTILLAFLIFSQSLSEAEQVHHIAQVACSECQGCSRSEQLAVIQVIRNRVRYTSTRPGHWWGYGLLSVLRYPQFARHSKRCSLIRDRSKLSPYNLNLQLRLDQIYKDAKRSIRTDVAPKQKKCYYFHAKRINPGWRLRKCHHNRDWHHIFYTKEKAR
mgnify:CR=1 FL=1